MQEAEDVEEERTEENLPDRVNVVRKKRETFSTLRHNTHL